jgi:hypothetical protein
MTDGLIVKQPYANEIINGVKTIEYRAKALPDDKKFIDVYILSEGHVLGTASFDKSIQTDDGFEWHIRRVNKFPQPKKYIHPKGARVWIRGVVIPIEDQLSE